MPAFGLTADSELQAALRAFSSQAVERKAPEFLFHQGDKPHGCYLIKRGKVRLSMESPSGQKIVQRVVGEGCLVGLPASINGRMYSLSCEVIEDVELAYVSRQDLALLMKSDTGTAMKLLDLLSIEVQAVRSEFADLPRNGQAQTKLVGI